MCNIYISFFGIEIFLGIYAAPETKDMAKHWNEFHPRGKFLFFLYIHQYN
jgi:hypothetical protein